MSIQANKQNAISLQIAIEEYFRDNNLDEEIIDYDFGNGAFTEWHFYCDDFKYIDDNILYDYIADLREFRDENFEVFSFRDEIFVKILDDELEESKKSARKSIKESETMVDVKYTVSYSGKSPSIDREFSTDYLYDLYDFKEVCDSLSESQNGYYMVTENHSGSVDANYRMVFYTFDDSDNIDGIPTGEIQFDIVFGYSKSIEKFFS